MATLIYTTEAGVECTPEECKAIAALERALKKWKVATKKTRLTLYATPDGINVMMRECDTNPHSENNPYGGMNNENTITLISLPIESGDW